MFRNVCSLPRGAAAAGLSSNVVAGRRGVAFPRVERQVDDLAEKRIYPPRLYSLFLRYHIGGAKWCTVTTLDGDGKRYSLDVLAESSFDAAHLYLTHVRSNTACGFPIPTTSTVFEVVAAGSVLHVSGARLKKWIEYRREEWKGPRGLLFKQRPTIGS